MDIKELEEQIRERCRLTHMPLDKKIQEHEDWLNCHDKKIFQKVDRNDLKEKADQKEVDGLKEWVSKIDRRFWAILVAAFFSAVGGIGSLIVLIFKFKILMP